MKRKEQLIRGLIASIIVLIILTIIYFVFTFLISFKMYIKYRAEPPGVDCKILTDTYSLDALTDLAGLEYLYH